MVSSRSSPQLGQRMIDCNMTSLTLCEPLPLKDIARLHRQTSLSLSFVGHLFWRTRAPRSASFESFFGRCGGGPVDGGGVRIIRGLRSRGFSAANAGRVSAGRHAGDPIGRFVEAEQAKSLLASTGLPNSEGYRRFRQGVFL